MTEDETVGWHHRLNEHEVEQTQGDSKGQGSLACYSSWGCKELDMTGQLNNNNRNRFTVLHGASSLHPSDLSLKIREVLPDYSKAFLNTVSPLCAPT